MAETDPRKVRPIGRADELRDHDSQEDPLIELARIVSEDSGFSGARTERPRHQREAPIDRDALSANLEAELLQELEASFAVRPPVPRSATLAPPTLRAQRIAEHDEEELLRSIEAELGDFTQRAQPAANPRSAREAQNNTALEPEPEANFQPSAPSAIAPARELSHEWQAERTDQDRHQLERSEEARPRSRERNAATRPLAWRDRPENGPANRPIAQPHRRTTAEAGMSAPELEPLPRSELQPIRSPLRRRDTPAERGTLRDISARGDAAGWSEISATYDAESGYRETQDWQAAPADYQRELRTTFGDFDEARELTPTAEHASAPSHAEFTSELEPGFADPTLSGDWAESDSAAELRVSPAGPLGAGMPTSSKPARPRSLRKRVTVAAGVLGMLVLGGIVLAFIPSADEAPSGAPPVIAAPAGAVKVIAAAEAEDAPDQSAGEAVYSRVAGDAPAAQEQVVDGAEEPREISRIVLPPSQAEAAQGGVRSVGESAGSAAPQDENADPGSEADGIAVGPRRVRTYVVRPDGTIAAADVTPSAIAAPAGQQLAMVSEPIVPVPVTTKSVNAAGDTASGEGAREPLQASSEQSMSAELPAVGDPVVTAPGAEDAEPPLAEMAAVEPEAEAPVEPTPAPAASDEAPVDLLGAAQPAAPVGDALEAEAGFRVQVSSQRTMAEAESSRASMQQRYPSILGDVPADIQEADLGAKGVYYRVRVGPWATRGEAIEVCEALQGAGASCFVTQ